MITQYPLFKDKLEIIAVFQSPADIIQEYLCQQTVPFRIIPDPKRRLYNLYRVESSWLGFIRSWSIGIDQVYEAVIKHRFLPGSIQGEFNRIPADFLIDKDNRILNAYYGKDIRDNLPNIYN